MASVLSDSEEMSNNGLSSESGAGDKSGLLPASLHTPDVKPELCAQGSAIKRATEPAVPSSSTSENTPPHGAARSPSDKDAAVMSGAREAALEELETGMLSPKNGGKAAAGPGSDFEQTLGHPHNESATGQELDNEGEATEKTAKHISNDFKADLEQEHPSKQDEPINASEESKCSREEDQQSDHDKNIGDDSHSPRGSLQSTETKIQDMEDPKTTGKDKENLKEKVVEEEDESRSEGTSVKQRKAQLECMECGKKFTRRETYNLHRYSHIHQDQEASLICKECGIRFPHRSDLIKHRSVHKVSTQISISHMDESKSIFSERKKFVCEHCNMCFSTMMRLRIHVCDQNVDKPFRCPLCRKEFQYRVSIIAHMASHSLDSPHRCLECNKGFQNLETLHIHQRSHTALKPFECPDCNMVFRHRSVMEDHRRSHTEHKAHLCKFCGKNFKYSSLLQQHQYLHTGQKPYTCSYCGKKFAFAQNMRAHFRQHKKILPRSEVHPNHDLSLEEQIGKENATVEQMRNCPLCPKIFHKASDLRAHMLIHEAEYERLSNGKRLDKGYECQQCPLKFQTEALLQSHLQTHTTNVLDMTTTQVPNQVKAVLDKQEDSGCNQEDTVSMEDVRETGDQTGRKSFRCRDCGKTFRYRSVLELHMRIHGKGYQCQVCKKSFRFSSYLQQHSIIHTGKKPYKCPDCGKDFAFHHNMKTHQRLHQQKPFRCTQCRKGYSEESQLQRHMLSHTGEKPYKCHLCDKSFALVYLLRDHVNTHTGERPHRCQECNKSFPWLSSLLVHQKIHTRTRLSNSHGYPFSILSPREMVGPGKRGRPRLDRGDGRPTQDGIIPETMLPNVHPHIYGSNAHELQLRQQLVNQSQQLQLKPEWHLQMSTQSEVPSQTASSMIEAKPTNPMHIQWLGVPHKAMLPPHSTNVHTSPQSNHYPDRIEAEQKGKHRTLWLNTPNAPLQKASLEALQMDRPSPMDVKMLSQRPIQDQLNPEWGVLLDSSQSAKPELFRNSEDGKLPIDLKVPIGKSDFQVPDSSGLPRSDQTGGLMLPSGASGLPNTNSWGKASLDLSSSVSLQDFPVDVLEKQQNRLIQHLPQQLQIPQQLHQQPPQLTPSWVSTVPPGQMGPINMSFPPAHFPLGDRPPLWSFQTGPVVSQSLMNGPVQQGHIQTQQHVALLTGQRIPLNQPPTFISSPFPPPPPSLNLASPHPLHSVGRPLPGPMPQGIFYTSPSSMMPQVPNLPHLAQQSELHKLSNKLPFGPEHRFQCMICGCSLPGELELQMHYMHHVQRDGKV